MSIQPSDFLQTAKQLYQDGNVPEADLRSAASRAYYAALHASHLALPDSRKPSEAILRNKGSHQAIIDALDAWAKAPGVGREQARKLVRTLRRLRDTRKNADYSLLTDFKNNDARLALMDASQVLADAAHARDRLNRQPDE